MVYQDFIKPELLVLVPVLYLIGAGLKKAETFKDKYIPIVLGIIGSILCGIWIVSTCEFAGANNILIVVFTIITQGVLVAGASVYANQVYKQNKGD